MSYSVKGKPFLFAGVKDVSECRTSLDVINLANLNYKVEKCELQGLIPQSYGYSTPKIHGYYATYRTDKNIPLGIVKEKYTVVQNKEAFNFFDNAIRDREAKWDTAGCFGDGETIFVSAILPETIKVGNNDAVENYLVFTNSHDGTSGVKIMITPIRIICQNVLNSAIRSASNYISFRHTSSVHSNIDIADEILGISRKKIIEFEEICNALNKTKITEDKQNQFIVNFILNDKEINNLKATGFTYKDIINRRWSALEAAEISTRKVNIITDIIDYTNRGIGQKEILGTAWGTLNGITGYYSNVANITGEDRMKSLLYGDRANKIKKATELLLAA